jgi:hypothetical protein
MFFGGFGRGQKKGSKSRFFCEIWSKFGVNFEGFWAGFRGSRGRPGVAKIVKNGQNRGFGDGLDLSLNAFFDI